MSSRKASKPKSRSREKHLCKLHDKPIRPSYWRAGHRNTGCSECYRAKNVPPPRKRLCARHDLPILRARWRSGYRTKGCELCFRVPARKNRLCVRHDLPILPSAWRNGRHSTGCSRCQNSRPGYAKAKARYNKRQRRKAGSSR